MPNACEIARDYISRGWSPIPIPYGKKCPRIKGWTELSVTDENVQHYFNANPQNVGVLLGDTSGDLVDVDLDCSEACAIAACLLPATNSMFGRASKPTSHFLFICVVDSQRFVDPETNDILLEIRSTGTQTVFPGSLHPSGEAIDWYEDGPISQIEQHRLVAAARRLAAASLLARRWPSPGGRHDAQLTLTALLVRSGWSIQQTARFVAAVALAGGGEPDLAKRLRTANGAAERLAKGEMVRGWPAFRALFGEKIAARAADWLGLKQHDRMSDLYSDKYHNPPAVRKSVRMSRWPYL